VLSVFGQKWTYAGIIEALALLNEAREAFRVMGMARWSDEANRLLGVQKVASSRQM
jgi:hypothetical protein